MTTISKSKRLAPGSTNHRTYRQTNRRTRTTRTHAQRRSKSKTQSGPRAHSRTTTTLATTSRKDLCLFVALHVYTGPLAKEKR